MDLLELSENKVKDIWCNRCEYRTTCSDKEIASILCGVNENYQKTKKGERRERNGY